ncbi:uncharacterized protein YbjT (DUF2867 family) [Actinoalloteichus hoggarensis]|uniref:NAD(P)H azoreductase n=1 Tax=Actinoalloteichus hoggarensis TaxID=1470176 RepID=A0A221W3V7_9PSEU|nr:NAD(P)H-binding protein [Actinoalloteichus hoggarensis]ASO20444.1 NAD(P)H azoreductase [Actinoalloteichus hoggarensis]MBB5923483.1 uncharacterized protein YbjT (DUF2867 family) [Actinoalloteichus hoggarensis]
MTGVLVTGGTGKTGSALAARLREYGEPVRVASRNPRATDSDSVRFDWADPTTHRAALRGMDRVYLVAPPTTVDDPMPLVEPFLSEAERIGVRRVVLLGSAIVLPNAPGALTLAAQVRARSGWVVLRASGFMQNFLPPHPLGDRIRRHGEIVTAAGVGRLGWIDARDVADAAAALLAERAVSPDDPRDHLLTGPATLSYPTAGEIISEHTGRRIRTRHVGVDQLTADRRAAGMPAEFAAALAAVEADIEHGSQDHVSTAVLELTGRQPRHFAEFVRDHAAEWAPGSASGGTTPVGSRFTGHAP